MKTLNDYKAAQYYFARFHRISWKQAFGLIAGAPFRLHHYRDVHTQMLRNALCEVDCHQHEDACSDE
jgi:hypothetical protein